MRNRELGPSDGRVEAAAEVGEPGAMEVRTAADDSAPQPDPEPVDGSRGPVLAIGGCALRGRDAVH